MEAYTEETKAFYSTQALKAAFDDYWRTPPKTAVGRPPEADWKFLQEWEKKLHAASQNSYKRD